MSTRDIDFFATITVGKDVINSNNDSTSALFGHELEHIDQGTFLAWSIQGEVMAYQTEYRIRDAAGIGQSSNTRDSMDNNGTPFDPNNYQDLVDARGGFLQPGYDLWYEPTLPWGPNTVHGLSEGINTMTGVYSQAVQGAFSLFDPLVTDLQDLFTP